MLSPPLAVEVLRSLRPHSAVLLPDGSCALVMCQMRNLVTVMDSGVVRVYERHELEPVGDKS